MQTEEFRECTTCAVCLEDVVLQNLLVNQFKVDQKAQSSDDSPIRRPISILSCGHQFHLDCILNTFQSSLSNRFYQCPICRKKQEGDWWHLRSNSSRPTHVRFVTEEEDMEDEEDEEPEIEVIESTFDRAVSHREWQSSTATIHHDSAQSPTTQHHFRWENQDSASVVLNEPTLYSVPPPVLWGEHLRCLYMVANERLSKVNEEIMQEEQNDQGPQVLLLEKRECLRKTISWSLEMQTSMQRQHELIAEGNGALPPSIIPMEGSLFRFVSSLVEEQLATETRRLAALQRNPAISCMQRRELSLGQRIGRLYSLQWEIMPVLTPPSLNNLS